MGDHAGEWFWDVADVVYRDPLCEILRLPRKQMMVIVKRVSN